MSTADLLILITAVTTAIVTIINAWKGYSDRQVLVTKADNAFFAAQRAEQSGMNSAAVILARTSAQDEKLTQIHEATNGGVQKLRDEVSSLKALLATAVEELRTERAKP